MADWIEDGALHMRWGMRNGLAILDVNSHLHADTPGASDLTSNSPRHVTSC